jgi:hypothetical protein
MLGRLGRSARASVALAVLLAACGQPVPTPQAAPVEGAGFASCDDVEPVALPREHLRDAPIYVANEQPIDELRRWAEAQPGFADLWIDREHLGWVVLAFTGDVEGRQAELSERFPDVGVVAVGVPRTTEELEDLQRRLVEDPAVRDAGFASWTDVARGVVGVEVGALSDDRLAALGRFAGEPVCVEGVDPADVEPSRPQATVGEGWRLLADELVGDTYRTGIAADPEGLARLWAEVGLAADLPTVDWETEVVVWFGAVYGSGCEEIRLDEVVVDHDLALLHARIVLEGAPRNCNDDANPRAFVVAVDRAVLPEAPFRIQLRREDPYPGTPGERTVVEADLREPGVPLPPDATGPDPSLEEPRDPEIGPGDIVEPGYPASYGFDLHCGPEWLGPLNGVLWRSEVTDTPDAWRAAMGPDGEYAVVEVLLETEPPRLTATFADHEVAYEPSAEEHPGCD